MLLENIITLCGFFILTKNFNILFIIANGNQSCGMKKIKPSTKRNISDF